MPTIDTAATSPILTNCPLCGEPGLKRAVNKRTVTDPFGGSLTIDRVKYTCDQCGAEGDLANENDAVYEAAKEALAKKAAMNILVELKDSNGISNLNLERRLGLPMRTVARWKMKGASAAATALLKFVHTFPWMLDVSAKGFEKEYAIDALIENAGQAKQRRDLELFIKNIEAKGATVGPSRSQTANEELALAA